MSIILTRVNKFSPGCGRSRHASRCRRSPKKRSPETCLSPLPKMRRATLGSVLCRGPPYGWPHPRFLQPARRVGRRRHDLNDVLLATVGVPQHRAHHQDPGVEVDRGSVTRAEAGKSNWLHLDVLHSLFFSR